MEKHSHGHSHTHHPESFNGIFIFCVVLNLLFVGFEAMMGFTYQSVGLLSDAGHNLSDVFSLLLALFAFRIAKKQSTLHFTYGYKKGTILISLTNALILLIAVGGILIESIYRLTHPSPVSGEAISWTAGIGIMVNGITTLLLMKGRKGDLNVQGAFLHMLADTLVSAGVVISGILISHTGWNWIDAGISMIIAFIILISTFKLLKESLFLSLDAVPGHVNIKALTEEINALPDLAGWHHLHVWALSTTENAATLHLVLKKTEDMEPCRQQLKEILKKYHISHSTIECETLAYCCPLSKEKCTFPHSNSTVSSHHSLITTSDY